MRFFIFFLFYIICIAVVGVVMVVVYITKYKGLPIKIWKPNVAWTRALIYFSFCNVFIAISGTLEQ
ncbi:MAG: hypothetical protein ACFFDG_06120, partial [Promethearchaeota archaeon]